MWRKVRTRIPASAVSLTVKSRTFMRYAHSTVTASTPSVAATMTAPAPTSAPPGGRSPRSMPCWMATGTTTRPDVATRARASVPAKPVRSSGDMARPRRRVCEVLSGIRPFPFPLGLGLLVGGDQVRVAGHGGQQLRMGAPRDDPAVLDVDDLVGERDGGPP